MQQNSRQSDQILYHLLQEWLSQQAGGSELWADFERDPEGTAPRLRGLLVRDSEILPPTLATYITGGRVEKLINIARAEAVHIHLPEIERPLTPEEREEEERRYLARVAEECRTLDTEGVDRVRTELTRVFVMLEALETPRPEERTDVAPVPERAEEMGLPERLTHHRERHEEIKQEQAESQRPPLPIPLSEALKKHARLVMLGEPGTGKTTTLKFLALCYAKAKEGWVTDKLDLEEILVPVRLDLKAWVDARPLGERLVEAVASVGLFDRFSQEESQIKAKLLLQHWLEEGRLAVLLDGLDEVPDQCHETVILAIERFAASLQKEAKNCRIVVTSRIAGYRRVRELGDFGHYTICPFTGPEDALPYTAGWLKQLSGVGDEEAWEEAQALLAEMEGREGLRKVRSNPLLLRLVIAVYADSGELARNRAQVYRRYVEKVIWERREAREQRRWSREVIEKAVEEIAWALQNYGAQTAADLAQAVADEGANDAYDLIHYLRERLGLLADYGRKQRELIAFRHLTFREYFVARRLARAWKQDKYRESTWRFLRPRLHDPAWREPILLLAGMLKAEANDLVCHVIKARSRYERVLHRDLLLAASIIAEGVEVEDRALQRVVGMLLTQFRTSSTGPTARISASTRLLERLSDENKDRIRRLPRLVRWFLGRLLVGYLYGYLLSALVKNLVGPLFSRAASAFRLLRGRQRFAVLDWRIDEALTAVGFHQPGQIAARLKDFLVSEGSDIADSERATEWPALSYSPGEAQDTRRRAADILVELNAMEHIKAALACREGRAPAARSLANQRKRTTEANELLVKASASSDRHVREAAAWILRVEDGPESAEALLRLAEDDAESVRELALRKLGDAWSYPWAQKALVILLAALVDRKANLQVRRAAVRALVDGIILKYWTGRFHAHIVGSSTIEIDLVQAIAGRQVLLLQAVESLRQDEPDSEEALRLLLELATERQDGSHGAGLQEVAIGLLVVLGASRPDMLTTLTERLLELGKAWEGMLHAPSNAIVKLAQYWPDDIVRILTDRKVVSTLSRLAQKNTPGALPALLALLDDESVEVRFGVVEGLHALRSYSPQVTRALNACLEDRDHWVQEAAAWALADLDVRTERVVSLVRQAIAHGHAQHFQYRRNITQLSWDIGIRTPQVVAALLVWCIHNWDHDRQQVKETLLQLYRAAPVSTENFLLDVLLSRRDEGVSHTCHRPGDPVRAAEMIGWLDLDTPKAREGLLSALQDAPCPNASAAWALGRIGRRDPGIAEVEALLSLLRRWQDHQSLSISTSASNSDQRRSDDGLRARHAETAILGLGYLGRNYAEVQPALLPFLIDDQYSILQRASAIALGQLGTLTSSSIQHLIRIWDEPIHERAFDAIRNDAWDNGIEVLWSFAGDEPQHLKALLVDAVRTGSAKAVAILFECLADQIDEAMLRSIAKAFQRYLSSSTVTEDGIYAALDQVVTRLTELEVDALGAEPDPFTPVPAKARLSPTPRADTGQAKDSA